MTRFAGSVVVVVVLALAVAAARPLPATPRKTKPLSPPTKPSGGGGGGGGGGHHHHHKSDVLRGMLSVCGGTIVHTVLGTLYCWGNFIAYAPDNLLYYDPAVAADRQPDALGIVPLTILFQTIGLPLGAELARRVGTSTTSILGGLLVATGVFLASYAPNLQTFMLLYGACFGFGVGIAYTSPLAAGWTWFPNHKGLVNGLVLLGFGTGGFLFNLIGTQLANPRGLKPPYPPEVYANFPSMLRTIATVYAVASIFGGMLVRAKPDDGASLDDEPASGAAAATAAAAAKDVSVRAAVRSPSFAALYAIIVLTASAGLTCASVYKLFASTIFDSDAFLATAGAMGAVFNGLGRLFWAASAVNTALVPWAAHEGQLAYLASTCLSFFCMGGTFSTAPTCCAIAFGSKSATRVYAYLFPAFALASLGGVEIAKILVPTLGWAPVYRLLGLSSLIALVILPLLDVP
ncbi:hypothetical protein CTAYLR_005867 [Chrysophaeum taylorii]|uniref:Uncharacterized protein n=1 Tax=Chrysophaeum taylorii TaxID=2483200 RepID=A0AAD7UHE1_9STRA|nr:hypothetical protein CTAYLR_005867 [Chrysophaeum taylorii]